MAQQLHTHLEGFHNPLHVYTEALVRGEAGLQHRETLLAQDTILLSFGNTTISNYLIPQSYLQTLPAESFVIRSTNSSWYIRDGDNEEKSIGEDHPERGGCLVLACNGNRLSDALGKNSTLDRELLHYGAIAGAYQLLELLGFAFLHPLQPIRPAVLQLTYEKVAEVQSRGVINSEDKFYHIDMVQSPYWPHRMFHLHTQYVFILYYNASKILTYWCLVTHVGIPLNLLRCYKALIFRKLVHTDRYAVNIVSLAIINITVEMSITKSQQ